MHSIDDQVILITGSTDGLGQQVARDLAERGATILLHGRSRNKGEDTLKEIKGATGNNRINYYNADLSSLTSVRLLAEEVNADHDRLDVLINNAGIGDGPRRWRREESEDGFELRFAVNYLSHFLLTHLLLPLLHRSAPARIVNVSSVGQQAIDFDDVMLEERYDGLRAYMQSKLAQVMFTFDLAEKLRGSGVTVNSLHPATLMNTNMVYESESFHRTMSRVEDGAEAVRYLATSPDLEGITGEYFDGKKESKANPQAYDELVRRRLWELSEKLTGLEDFHE